MHKPRQTPPEKLFGIGSGFNEYNTEPWKSRLRNAMDTMRSTGDVSARRAAKAQMRAKKNPQRRS